MNEALHCREAAHCFRDAIEKLIGQAPETLPFDDAETALAVITSIRAALAHSDRK